jgi:hypothetical protein
MLIVIYTSSDFENFSLPDIKSKFCNIVGFETVNVNICIYSS